MRIEIRQILLQHRRRIAFRIDGDEQRAGAVGILAERFEHFGDLEQARRANIGAVGVAEEHQIRPALHVLVGHRLAVLVFEMKRAADRADRRGRTARQVARGGEHAGQDQHQAARRRRSPARGGCFAQHPRRCLFRLQRPRSTRQPKHAASRRGWSRKTPSRRNGPTANRRTPAAAIAAAPASKTGREIDVGRGA